MLAALLHTTEPGRICELVIPGKEFEVHENFKWVYVPDDTTVHDRYNADGTITKWDPLTAPGADQAHIIARTMAYGSIGEQLSMLHAELMQTGTISKDGPWATHINNVKATIPKGDPAAAFAWMRQHSDSLTANAKPTGISLT